MADRITIYDIPDDQDFKYCHEGVWLDCAFVEIGADDNVVIFDVNNPDDEYGLSEEDINNPEIFQLTE